MNFFFSFQQKFYQLSMRWTLYGLFSPVFLRLIRFPCRKSTQLLSHLSPPVAALLTWNLLSLYYIISQSIRRQRSRLGVGIAVQATRNPTRNTSPPLECWTVPCTVPVRERNTFSR